MLYGKALWMDRCILDELPVCEDYVQSLGCPPEGILPCQFDSSLPQSLNGNSHCYSAQEWNVCNRELEDCHKIVTSNYIRGQLEYWNVFQGCGPCPFSESVVSTCRAENCLGVEAGEGVSGVCASECFWKSEMRLQVATCYQCGSELCNLSSRRLAHAASSLLGLALFTVLLLRKCRA